MCQFCVQVCSIFAGSVTYYYRGTYQLPIFEDTTFMHLLQASKKSLKVHTYSYILENKLLCGIAKTSQLATVLLLYLLYHKLLKLYVAMKIDKYSFLMKLDEEVLPQLQYHCLCTLVKIFHNIMKIKQQMHSFAKETEKEQTGYNFYLK